VDVDVAEWISLFSGLKYWVGGPEVRSSPGSITQCFYCNVNSFYQTQVFTNIIYPPDYDLILIGVRDDR
jgi:hypothetical protein